MNRLFVYGSLKRGYGNNRLLEKSEFIGVAKTKPEFTMIAYGWFPACLVAGKTIITGEVYDVNDGVLDRVDRLEGHPTWYQRIRCYTTQGDAWIYTMKPESYVGQAEVIRSGLWAPPMRG